MKIAINTSPLSSLHAGRGIGQYTNLLVESVTKYDPKNSYIQFTNNLQEQVSIVHYPFFDIYAHSLKFFQNTKTVVTIHDLIPLKYPGKFPAGIRGKISWWLQKSSLKKVDAIITDSEASAKDIENIAHIDRNKIHVIPLAVSTDYKKLTPGEVNEAHLNKYELPKDFILYVGDVNWNKNIAGLLMAFSEVLKEKRYSDLQLVLAGSSFLKKDLQEVQEINRIIERENIGKQVKMVGFVPIEELVGLFNRAKLYIQPSFDEGFGLSPLEALSCGTMVVSSKAGSLPEVLGTAAEYFDPVSVSDIAAVMKKSLLYSEKERKEKIDEGLRQAKRFTAAKFAQETIRVYENVATNSSL